MNKIDKINIDYIVDHAQDCFEDLIDYIKYIKLDNVQDDKLNQFYENVLNLINSFVLKVKELALKVYEK